ncbi:hypothetical protein ACFV8E_17410 [Streptomyces sp. NPDC059849]|uniref:hypothetical protein n=1 Tax=Streptomyces sp. NPDC059849 TaxID=3346969 RepID=UPI00365E1C7A
MTTALPPGPVMTVPLLGGLPLACGKYLEQAYLTALPWADRWKYDDLDIVTGIYLVTDTDGRLRWLGQASRDDDLLGRLDDHDRNAAKRAVFARVRVLHLHDNTPLPALNAIEGKCADLLGTRQIMKPRRWPPADGWASLVA